MNARLALAAVLVSSIAASPAAATVLSASSQAVGTKSSKASYLRVTEVQKELNATMAEVNDAAVASGPLSAPAPASGEAGFILQKEGEGGKNYSDDPFVAQANDDGLDHGKVTVPLTPRGRITNIDTDSRHHNGNRRGGGGGGGQGKHGGGAHASPEPSTWMLLGSGLALFGIHMTLRRRNAMAR
jgi:hypothetical protein